MKLNIHFHHSALSAVEYKSAFNQIKKKLFFHHVSVKGYDDQESIIFSLKNDLDEKTEYTSSRRKCKLRDKKFKFIF